MDILTGCTGSIAAEVVKCTAKPVIRHVGYLFRFKKTVDDLTKAKTDLQVEQQKVQEAIERAAMNNEIAEKDVERWLTNVNQLMEEVQALEIKVQVNLRFCNGWCPDWIRQYKLCKEAIQKTNVVKELQDKGKFSELTHRAPIPGIEIFSSSDFEVFESRKLAFQQIMEALHDDDSQRIGLHGIGGVGKTTLVKEVHKKTKELNLFDEIVMTVVSLTPNVRRIQGEIAGCLNLKLDNESDMARASEICLRIKKAEKILIILDDVWKDVNLEAIGIPSRDDHRGCKMLLTTRSVHVCNLMRCQRKIPLNFLVEEESLALMKKTAIVDDCPGLNDVVLEVVKECKGLPIAIITVGKALTGKSLNDWNVAMHQLRKSRLVDIEGVDEDKNAYACLKWSFDQLKRKTKLCFLLCSLFPEDYNIPIEELTRYVMGLEEDEDFHLLEDARCQVRAAVNSLKDSSLLLEGFGKEFVKMHDMVRDIGLWITSKGENEFELRACTRLERNKNFERATAIFLIDFNTKQLPDKLVCPRLNILLLGGIQSSKNISNALFEGMNCLKVLSLHDIILSSQSLELLTNLRTLYLNNCNFNDNLSSLGKLKRLEALSFYRCGIKALPSELGEMTSLKMLHLTYCHKLERIPSNVIGRLSQLEELIIISNRFRNWDVEGTTTEISNANLSELNSLPRLVNLSLNLSSNHLPKGFVFSEHLRRYVIDIGYPFLSAMTPRRTLAIKDLNASSMNALKSLFHTVEYFLIKSCEMECIADTISEGMILESHNQPICLSKLETLVVENCRKLEYIFPISVARGLQQLEWLELRDLPRLKQVFGQNREGEVGDCEIESHHQPTGFPKLKTIRVWNCRNLVCLSTARDFPQLESLELHHLPQLKQVFGQNREGEVGGCETESHHQPTGFPKLKTILVWNCNNLVCLSTARDLPQLESLELRDLPQLKQVFGQNREGEVGDCEIESHHQPTGFPKLKTIRVWNCSNLVCLSTARDFPQLESLELHHLPQLKQVFGQNREGEVGDCETESHHQPTGFPKLKTILVWNCSNLVCLSTARDLPQLESLELRDLPQLKQVFGQNREGEVGDCEIESHHQPTGFPKLKTILVWNCSNLVCLSTARDLPQLEKLSLYDLPQLKQVFGHEKGGDDGDGNNSVLSKLRELILVNLPELVSLGGGNSSSVWPSLPLERLEVVNCPKVKWSFFATVEVNVPALQKDVLWLVPVAGTCYSLYPVLVCATSCSQDWDMLTICTFTYCWPSLGLGTWKASSYQILGHVTWKNLFWSSPGLVSFNALHAWDQDPRYNNSDFAMDSTHMDLRKQYISLPPSFFFYPRDPSNHGHCFLLLGWEPLGILELGNSDSSYPQVPPGSLPGLSRKIVVRDPLVGYIQVPSAFISNILLSLQVSSSSAIGTPGIPNMGAPRDPNNEIFFSWSRFIIKASCRCPPVVSVSPPNLVISIGFAEIEGVLSLAGIKDLLSFVGIKDLPGFYFPGVKDLLDFSGIKDVLSLTGINDLLNFVGIKDFFSLVGIKDLLSLIGIKDLPGLCWDQGSPRLYFPGVKDLLDFAGIKNALSLAGIKDLLCFVGINDLLSFVGIKDLPSFAFLKLCWDQGSPRLCFPGVKDLLDFAGIKNVLSLAGINDLLSFVGTKDFLGFAGIKNVLSLAGIKDLLSFVGTKDFLGFARIKNVLSLAGIKDLLNFVGIKDLPGFAGIKDLQGIAGIMELLHFAKPVFPSFGAMLAKGLLFPSPFSQSPAESPKSKWGLITNQVVRKSHKSPQGKNTIPPGTPSILSWDPETHEDPGPNSHRLMLLHKTCGIWNSSPSGFAWAGTQLYKQEYICIEHSSEVNNLKKTCQASYQSVKNLQNLQILSLRDWNATSFDLMQGLSNLEELEIKNCGGIQEVIKLEGLLTIKGEQQDLLLPRLKKMLLIDLLELSCIWKGATKLINLNNLEDLEVIRCKKLTHLFTPALAQSLQKLKFLKIERCDELEHLIVENAEEQVLLESHPQPLCFLEPNVVKVVVESCNKLKYLFHVDHWNPVSIFLRLEELELKNCGGLQEVFNFEGFLTREGEQQDEFFPRLRKMCLVELHELTYIWKGPIQLINLNNLEDLKVIGCKKMTHLFTPALAQSLQKLKFLEIERCDELEHIIVENVEEQVSSENHLQPLCFPKLIRVNVKYCNKLKYLFPMTIADSLLELKILIVKENSQLLEVFTHEGDAGVQKDVTLPQLQFMGLKGLPSLVNFCPKNYQFILPKWMELSVESCKNMRTTFTRTPDKRVLINGEVAQIDEPTGTSTISPVLTICPANNDITWWTGFNF
uniref:Disease resistance protein n=1 Tax=Quercus lobata TaxID=97700 RepID=A0A7N2M911_QUELO